MSFQNCWWQNHPVCKSLSVHQLEVWCPVSLLFGRKQMWTVLSVAFEQLVDKAELALFLDRIEGWEGVAFILQYSHFGSVEVLSVGESCHPCVAARLNLKPRRKNFEELWNQVLLLQGQQVIESIYKVSRCTWMQRRWADTHRQPKTGHFHCFLISVSLFGIID